MRNVNSKEFQKAMIDAECSTLIELEKKTGINRVSLSNFIKGETKPSYDSIAALSDTLSLSYEEIGRIFFTREITEA